MLRLDTWDTIQRRVTSSEVRTDPHAADTWVDLKPIEGATALELLLSGDGSPVYWGELNCDSGAPARVRLFKVGNEWQASSTAGSVFRLDPCAHRRTPLLAIPEAGATDLVFLIDGTARDYRPAGEAPSGGRDGTGRTSVNRLLPDSDSWRTITSECVALATALERGEEPCRWAIVVFGDHVLPWVSRHELRPSYVVHPDEDHRGFRTGIGPVLNDGLLKLMPGSGGDFVDALADGLAAVAALPWSPTSRKVLVVIGDSPGYAVLAPPPPLANAHTRLLDVDWEAERLHGIGVEIMTVLHDMGAGPQHFIGPDVVRFLRYTETQYRSLASMPSYALRSSTFRGEDAAAILRAAPSVVARGPFPGVLLNQAGQPAVSPTRDASV